ncbi:MAG: glutamate ABC transporter substrate-binding protein [Mycobacterium sp.]
MAIIATVVLVATRPSGAGKLRIGVKYDQPGLSVKSPDGSMSGFDVDVATYVAEQLGYKPEDIEWKQASPGDREQLIEQGEVDYLVASYSITPERKQKVGFAGPYFQTGQSLLVRADNTDIAGPESLTGNRIVCSVPNSTSAQRITQKYPDVQLRLYETYSACVQALKNGKVEAVTTDAVILAGYATQEPGAMKIVGQPFSMELYGIGLAKDNSDLRAKINGALQTMIDSGQWQAAFDKNLGPSGYKAPPPPRIDR